MLAPILAYVGILCLGYGSWHLYESVTVINEIKFRSGVLLVIIGIPLFVYVCTLMVYIRLYLEDKIKRPYL